MDFYWLILGALGVWRITHLLQAEEGPWDIVVRLRTLASDTVWGRLLDCFYCLSLWIAAPFAFWIGATPGEQLALWPALSGAAILLERITTREAPPPTATYFENEGDDSHGMLRGK